MPDSRLVRVVLAVVFLDASVTFRNWWPTPGVWWSGAPSVELAVLVLVLLAATVAGRLRPPAARLLPWLSAGWLLLIIGRYVDVTAPALWGRELNFYWDLRFVPDVAAMLLDASGRAWLMGALAAGVIVTLVALVFVATRWSWRQVLEALTVPRGRAAMGTLAALGVVLFGAQVAGLFGLDLLGEERRVFTRPVTQVYARQARLLAQAVSKTADLPPSPNLDADLARVQGADVFLFFMESYGAVAFENAAFDARLRQPRAALAEAIRATGRDAVSAFVESPTFGGSSWFAHITFLSGIKVGDPDTNALLMTERRPTVVTTFAQHGYRTLAVMPGLWYPWPEGSFYGFQDTYNGPALDYKGPSFGWWDMPDQYTLARLDAAEVDKPDRPPLFVFFPTVSTHTPFSPLAPYQPDWPKMLTEAPFTEDELDRAYVGEPDYMNLGPGYADALAYAYEAFAGYVRQRAGRDYVLILIGDHQPPALVSGEGAPWDVPMHVITNRPAILDGLIAHGFTRGLRPARPRLGEMQDVVPVLMKAFSEK